MNYIWAAFQKKKEEEQKGQEQEATNVHRIVVSQIKEDKIAGTKTAYIICNGCKWKAIIVTDIDEIMSSNKNIKKFTIWHNEAMKIG